MFVYMGSDYVQYWASEHKTQWLEKDYWTYNKTSTPELAIPIYYTMVEAADDLITQEDYFNHLANDLWPDYYSGLSVNQQLGFKTRVYNLLYPSCVDQIYCQSLLAETQMFDKIYYAQELETAGVDLAVVPKVGMKQINVGLRVGTKLASFADQHRPGQNDSIEKIVIAKPIRQRSRTFGNLYWYELDDFQPLLSMIDSGNVLNATA